MRQQNALSRRNAPNKPNGEQMPVYGRIVATYPEQNQVDVAVQHGGVLRRVKVARGLAGSFEGSSYLPLITNPNGTQTTGDGPVTDLRKSGTDTYAIVSFLGGDGRRPVVTGFLPPERFMTSFKEQDNVEVQRHRNGMYTNYTSDGFEISHPSGTFIRIGVGIVKTDLNGKNVDTQVPFDDTSGSASAVPDIIIKHVSGTSIRINPSGSIVITKAGGGSFALESHTHGVTTAPGTTGPPA